MNCWQRFLAAAIVLCSNAAAASSFPAHSAAMQLFLDNYRADGGFMATSAFREMDPEGALSFVVEVSDHVSRTGDRQQAQSLGRCAVRLFRFLERYEMPDGLLANLPSCVFSEKSVDKGSGRGVSLPASALYARALESTARLYGRRDWRERSIRVRKAVLERSSSDGVACEGLARVGERESRNVVLRRKETCLGTLASNLDLPDGTCGLVFPSQRTIGAASKRKRRTMRIRGKGR